MTFVLIDYSKLAVFRNNVLRLLSNWIETRDLCLNQSTLKCLFFNQSEANKKWVTYLRTFSRARRGLHAFGSMLCLAHHVFLRSVF